jgi:hypothetical protein
MYKSEKIVMSLTLGEKLLSFDHLLPTITKEIAHQVHGCTTMFIKSTY